MEDTIKTESEEIINFKDENEKLKEELKKANNTINEMKFLHMDQIILVEDGFRKIIRDNKIDFNHKEEDNKSRIIGYENANFSLRKEVLELKTSLNRLELHCLFKEDYANGLIRKNLKLEKQKEELEKQISENKNS